MLEVFNICYIYYLEKLLLGKKCNMFNELVCGEYIFCMDDDDYYLVDKIFYIIVMM